MDSIILHKDGEVITYNKDEIIREYESDWDDENIFYKINPDGKIIKINIATWDIFEYELK